MVAPDFFVLLNQPRRPWLDPERLKQEYQRLTFAHHPDRIEAADDPSEFADLTGAYRVLSNPKSRLQHLLNSEASAPQTSEIPSGVAGLFMSTAELVRQIDQLLQRRDGAVSALAKSMLRSELVAIQTRAEVALKELEGLYEMALTDLKQLDERWTNDRQRVVPELARLSQQFGYLERWIGQLREKQFQLANE
jgi:curved DNA-binding protein CbpA